MTRLGASMNTVLGSDGLGRFLRRHVGARIFCTAILISHCFFSFVVQCKLCKLGNRRLAE